MKIIYILILLTFSYVIAIENQWMVYDRSNSEIPCINLRYIEVDREDNLWICTNQEFLAPSAFGLLCYDRNNWSIFKPEIISAKYMNSMIIDKNDKKWITAWDGLFLFDNNKLYPFSEIYNDFSMPGCLKVINDSSNNVWVSSAIGLHRFNNNKYELFDTSNSPIPGNFVGSLTINKKQQLYLGFWGRIYRFNNGQWDSLRFLNRYLRGPAMKNRPEFDMEFDIYGNLWIDYSYADSIIRMDTNENITIFDKKARGLNKRKDLSLDVYSDANGDVWFCTSGSGLFHYDGEIWEVFDTTNSPLPSKFVNTAKMDRFGNLWIGTQEGLAVYNPNGIVGVEDKVTEGEKEFSCYPNPSSGFITLRYRIKKYSEAVRYISDILGNRIEIRKENKFPGDYIEDYNLSHLPNGIYFATIKSGTEVITKQFEIMR